MRAAASASGPTALASKTSGMTTADSSAETTIEFALAATHRARNQEGATIGCIYHGGGLLLRPGVSVIPDDNHRAGREQPSGTEVEFESDSHVAPPNGVNWYPPTTDHQPGPPVSRNVWAGFSACEALSRPIKRADPVDSRGILISRSVPGTSLVPCRLAQALRCWMDREIDSGRVSETRVR